MVRKGGSMLPWYRAPGYKGKMREVDKCKLDAIRMQPKHPAATSDDLPEEAQAYINRLECEIYDINRHTPQ